ncbi:MAG: hypothetical protein AAFQ87_09760, partial [Bacteroidota bacterium]
MAVQTYIRDPQWREKIQAKIAEIQAVRDQHRYLNYMHNWHLFDQLEVMYQEHQTVLEASYLGPLRRNDRLKAQLASLDDIHPLRLGKARQLLKEIEAKLRAEDYATNAEATPLLD